MLKEIILTNYTEKYNTNNFFNYSSHEMDIDIIFGKIINKEVLGEETILTIKSDKYGRIGYFFDNVLYTNGNLTGIRGLFHLEIDKEKMKRVFNNALFHCYENGTIVNTLIDDPKHSVYKKNLIKIGNSLCIYEPREKEIPLNKVIVVNDEQIIIKKKEILEIITYIRFPHEEVFNYYRSVDGYYDTEQTYWTLKEIYISIQDLKKIKNFKPRLSGYFERVDDDKILSVPFNKEGVYHLITSSGIFPTAVVDILWSPHDDWKEHRYTTDEKKWIRDLRKKAFPLTKEERKKIKNKIKNILDEIDYYDFRILFLV